MEAFEEIMFITTRDRENLVIFTVLIEVVDAAL